MKKAIAMLFAVASGIYLLTFGVLPDPVPIVDEATALLVLVSSLSALGLDISRFLPFLGKKVPKQPGKKDDKGPVVDV